MSICIDMMYNTVSFNSEEKRNDVIDFLIDSFQEVTSSRNIETGQMENTLQYNPNIAWFQAHNINRPFGNYAKLLERWANLAIECYSHMSPEPAAELAKDILLKLNEHKRGIDGKSSETYRDKNNTQASLLQMLSDKKQERIYTVKGDGRKTFLDGLLGRDGRDESEK